MAPEPAGWCPGPTVGHPAPPANGLDPGPRRSSRSRRGAPRGVMGAPLPNLIAFRGGACQVPGFLFSASHSDG